jgi:hypothetical protein
MSDGEGATANQFIVAVKFEDVLSIFREDNTVEFEIEIADFIGILNG